MAAVITAHATQPRGAPARLANAPGNIFQNSMGSIKTYSSRDPSVFAASSLAAGFALAAVITPHFT